MPPTDAERLIKDLCAGVIQSPFALALERQNDLLGIMGGTAWCVEFRPGKANFTAYPADKEIVATYAALLSLWATARAAVLIAEAGLAATRAGQATLDQHLGTTVCEALELAEAARLLIRDPAATWPITLQMPVAQPAPGSREWNINNIFQASAGFIFLHEIAHIKLRHGLDQMPAAVMREENEADHWATSWIFKSPPNSECREFRIFAEALAFVWIGLID